MRILHLSHDGGWFTDHFNYQCEQLGHMGETQLIGDYGLTVAKADLLWKEHSEYYNSFDAVFVSHLPSLARIFLQNDWKKPLYIWLSFRFDYFSHSDEADIQSFRDLIKQASRNPLVKIFSWGEHGRMYVHKKLGYIPIELVPPFIFVDTNNKVPIPCSDRLFIVSKHNETIFMNLEEKLSGLGVPTYRHNWESGPPSLEGVKGIIHLPYHYMTRSLYENMALENVYFLPSLDFMKRLICSENYFWDIQNPKTSDIELTEWYDHEHWPLFIYFSNFEELKAIVENPSLDNTIAEKKRRIHEYNQRHNEMARKQWGAIFS